MRCATRHECAPTVCKMRRRTRWKGCWSNVRPSIARLWRKRPCRGRAFLVEREVRIHHGILWGSADKHHGETRAVTAKPVSIAVVGSGYVGLVAAVCFAEIGHSVVCVDNDERKVAALESGDTLIHEKHLPELLLRYRNTKIRFTTDLSEATRDCEAIFIAVGTPQSESGDADLSYVEAVACE